MARRYGKVTVTGWIEQYALGRLTLSVGEGPRQMTYTFSAEHNVEVEFLPEPVVFKDGDALRSVDGTCVWGRHNGTWHKAFLGVSQWSDDEMASLLRAGRVVRLVAEGATDAG